MFGRLILFLSFLQVEVSLAVYWSLAPPCILERQFDLKCFCILVSDYDANKNKSTPHLPPRDCYCGETEMSGSSPRADTLFQAFHGSSR